MNVTPKPEDPQAAELSRLTVDVYYALAQAGFGDNWGIQTPSVLCTFLPSGKQVRVTVEVLTDEAKPDA